MSDTARARFWLAALAVSLALLGFGLIVWRL